jgi:alkylhydroperoxidase family enzyme
MASLDNFHPRHLDGLTLDYVFEYLPKSPRVDKKWLAALRHNQIASCNRAFNMAWRRAFFPRLRQMVQDTIETSSLHPKYRHAQCYVQLDRISDLLGCWQCNHRDESTATTRLTDIDSEDDDDDDDEDEWLRVIDDIDSERDIDVD